MKIVNLKTEHRYWINDEYQPCRRMKASEQGLQVDDYEPEFIPVQLTGKTMWSTWTDGKDFRKQFPEGVMRCPRYCRFKDWATGKPCYGEVTDAYLDIRNDKFEGFYQFEVAWGSMGWKADVRPEDIEFLGEGVNMPLKRGQQIYVWRNQSDRFARVLNVHEDLALVEYEMPNGRTFTNVVHRFNKDLYRTGKVPFLLTFYTVHLEEEHGNIDEFYRSLSSEAKDTFNLILEQEDRGYSYAFLKRIHHKAKDQGLYFDYGLDGEPYDFRAVVKLTAYQ